LREFLNIVESRNGQGLAFDYANPYIESHTNNQGGANHKTSWTIR